MFDVRPNALLTTKHDHNNVFALSMSDIPKQSNSVFQHWGHDPMWDCLKFKRGRLKKI